MTVAVEQRDIDTVVVHGSIAGVAAGLALGAVTILVSLILSGSALLPFRFAAALAVGPDALAGDFPIAAAMALGLAIHFSVAALLGILFVGLLAVAYQLSARAWLLIVYGAAFGFATWEVNFLAALPALFPQLVDLLDLRTQVWNGIVAYVFVFGTVLGAYVAVVRPGVIGDWGEVGPPAGTFGPRTEPDGE